MVYETPKDMNLVISNLEKEDQKLTSRTANNGSTERVALIISTFMGVVVFITNTVLAGFLNAATGIPNFGAFIMVFAIPMLYVCIGLLIPRFGYTTWAAIVHGSLNLFVFNNGPPWFLPKVLITTFVGLMTEIGLRVSANKNVKIAAFAGFLGTFPALPHMAFWFSLFLDPVAAAAFLSLLPIFLVLSSVLSPLGGIVGWRVYLQIRKSRIISIFQ